VAPVKFIGWATLVLGLMGASACTAQLDSDSLDSDSLDAGASTGSGGAAGVPSAGELGAFKLPQMRRLNRTEYDNTVRDLLRTELRPGEAFPTDDVGGGFPTVGSSLSLSPAYVLAYEDAAHALVSDLFSSDTRRSQIVTCDIDAQGDTCARELLGAFARKAWRRPVTEDEVTSLLLPLTVAAEHGASRTDGLRHALAAVLLSPYFIFKVEVSADWLDGYELASRLSYALWGTMPDDALFAAAEAGELAKDDGLSAQVERMLEDPRAEALLENFAARWLDYYDIERHEVNAEVFPEFTPALAESMKREANFFIADMLRSDVSVREMLLATHTFVDEGLSAHYGLTEPPPADAAPGELWRVDTPDSERGGLLTLGALLTHTSLTSRTSPVKRGDFVLKHMLCGTIAPPPPGVEGLPDSTASENETLRERLERHTQDPDCAVCHKVMDPIGFGLENFDAIGRFRTHDGESEVDASGMMPDDTPFEGARELARILADDERFAPCITEHFVTYAIGRLLKGKEDEGWVAYLTAEAGGQNATLKSIIETVVLSEPFRRRMAQ
jgi:hypothetical protein